jgi:hypothetical protein
MVQPQQALTVSTNGAPLRFAKNGNYAFLFLFVVQSHGIHIRKQQKFRSASYASYSQRSTFCTYRHIIANQSIDVAVGVGELDRASVNVARRSFGQFSQQGTTDFRVESCTHPGGCCCVAPLVSRRWALRCICTSLLPSCRHWLAAARSHGA